MLPKGAFGGSVWFSVAGFPNNVLPPVEFVKPPPPKIGFAVPFVPGGEVCIESGDWPNGVGFVWVLEPNRPVDGAAIVVLGWPKRPPPKADDAGVADGPVLLVLPNPPNTELVCGAEDGTLKMFPLKPPKPPLAEGWFDASVFVFANGFSDPEPNELKLNLGAVSPPPPKEKDVDVF